jgi:hypothetical protein
VRKLFLVPLATALIAASPAPSPDNLRQSVGRLVSFGTRHTLSSATDPKRGIGAARDWASTVLTETSTKCGACLTVERVRQRFDGPRAPSGVAVENVFGIQRGTGAGAGNDVVIVAAHIDSRVSDVMDATGDAPGANDDASGVALVLEAARLLSQEKHRATIVYAVLTGEEQGLWGGKLLAETAQARGWNVLAMLNNDIVGNTRGQDGRIVADRVRIFSEAIRFADDEAAQRRRRGNGGEDDGPSRALAKAVKRIAGTKPPLTPFLVRRPDRFSRGGDHLPMLEAGFPAVRFSVGVENYDAQHQTLRRENGRIYGDTADQMDFAYLAKVTELNMKVLRELAAAPAPPASVTLGGAVSSDTKIGWTAVQGVAGYRIRWREADRQDWQMSRDAGPSETSFTLPGVIVDDHFFGVSSLDAAGRESLVAFGGAPLRE